MDLKLVLLHLNEATHEDGTLSAPELIMAIKWYDPMYPCPNQMPHLEECRNFLL